MLPLLAFLFPLIQAQQPAEYTPEVHPSLLWSLCSTSSGCTTVNGSIVLDANYRWIHALGGYNNCQVNGAWNTTLCPDAVTCAKNCVTEGVTYSTYGVATSGNALSISYAATSGARLYLLQNETSYYPFHLLNKEIAFTVDLSTIGCNLNAAFYFSEMWPNGGLSATNLAGANYGTGYCDAQCPEVSFVQGLANLGNSSGTIGTCCNEMDVWEANKYDTAYTPHPCNATGPRECLSGNGSCSGVCDSGGCDWNSYRLGNQTFYGPDQLVNTNLNLTVITQFYTSDGTDTGTLSAIARYYIQNNTLIYNAFTNVPNLPVTNVTTDEFCAEANTAFGSTTEAPFQQLGGLETMGGALGRGMTLVFSLWSDSSSTEMLWLDGLFPENSSPSSPGNLRGPCNVTESQQTNPDWVTMADAATVIWSDIRFGDIGSTYPNLLGPPKSTTTTTTTKITTTTTTTTSKSTTTTTKPTTTTSSIAPSQTLYGQCGGIGWNGPITCPSGSTCTHYNAYYYQCVPNSYGRQL